MNVRKLFLEYFIEKNHQLIDSSSLVPVNDKSLLFTNSGMVQFKDIFLGNQKPKNKRIVTCQKCMRAGGKHNDLENIGFTNRHHSFFEMLGNFSFGDYFKEEAIDYAWDFITNRLSLDKKNLYISVHKDDQETADIWLNKIKIDEKHLSFLDDNDNFWQMGETGPCGPSTEIYYDLGPNLSGQKPGLGETGDRYTEIWNLVFTQYNRDERGQLTDLPAKCVDTGMGLERIQAVVEGKVDNYQASIFIPLSNYLDKSIQKKKIDFVIKKIIMDHVRAACFLISDGVIPEKDGRGYVLRRIIRRAIRYLYNAGIKEPYLFTCADTICQNMSEYYPYLKNNKKIKKVILNEEENCLKTLSIGLELINKAIKNNNGLTGEEAFKLYDTYGFPIEIIQEIANENKFSLDLKEFNILMNKQRQRSKNASKFDIKDNNFLKDQRTTEFVGYEILEHKSKIVDIYDHQKNKITKLDDDENTAILVIESTPFYAEGGGQQSDKGIILNKSFQFQVDDVQMINNTILHIGRLISGEIKVGDEIQSKVEEDIRKSTAINHSATHLLHNSLREILGEDVQQRGSSVTDKRLTFDFTYEKALTKSQITSIENDIAKEIDNDIQTVTEEMKYKDAINAGAIAFFEEKYGDEVRVLKIGSKSVELCGGTHINSTSDIKVFKILNESSVSTGVRRIEAVTSNVAYTYFQDLFDQNKEISQLLNIKPNEIKNKIQDFRAEQSKTDKKFVDTNKILAKYLLESLELKKNVSKSTVLFIEDFPDLEVNQIKILSDLIKTKYKDSISIFCQTQKNEINCFVGVSKESKHLYNAKQIVQMLNDKFGSKGGGSDTFATSIIKNTSSADVLNYIKQTLKEN